MAVAFRNKTWVTNTALNVTPTEPTGAASGDIIFVWIITDKVAGGATTISAPDGTWTAVSTTLAGTSSIGRLFWIRRGSSAPTYNNFNWNGSVGSYYECHVSAWSGCKSSGNPWDQLGTILNQSVSGAGNVVQLNNPITPTVAPSLCVLFSQYWNGNSVAYTAPTGYTLSEGAAAAGEDECGAYKSLATTATETPGTFGGANIGTNDGMGYTLNLVAASGTSIAWIRS
jgi:hypothetical protein